MEASTTQQEERDARAAAFGQRVDTRTGHLTNRTPALGRGARSVDEARFDSSPHAQSRPDYGMRTGFMEEPGSASTGRNTASGDMRTGGQD